MNSEKEGHRDSTSVVVISSLIGAAGVIVSSFIACAGVLVQQAARSSNDALLADLQRRQQTVQERLAAVDERQKLADTAAVEIQNAKSCSQAYVVEMGVRQSGSVNHVREIDLQVEVQNTCSVPVPRLELVIRVYEGVPADEANDVIGRTQKIARLEAEPRILAQAGLQQSDDFSTVREMELRNLHADCPHGRLFAVDKESKDVRWKLLNNLTRRESAEPEIAAGTSHRSNTKFLLTEYPAQHHRQWFLILVDTRSENEANWQSQHLIVSGLPLYAEGSVITTPAALPATNPQLLRGRSAEYSEQIGSSILNQ